MTKEDDELLDAAVERIEKKRVAIRERRARGEIGDLVASVAAKLEGVLKAARRSSRRKPEPPSEPDQAG